MLEFFRRSDPPRAPSWKSNALFRGLAVEELNWIEQHIEERLLPAGETLVQEGEHSRVLYVILEGSLQVVKQEKLSTRTHDIGTLGAGDVVGEVGLLDGGPRTAAVVALTDCHLYSLSFENMRLTEKDGTSHRVLLRTTANLASILAKKLRAGSETALVQAHDRTAMGDLIVNMLILLCGYVLLSAALPTLDLQPSNTMMVTVPVMLVFGIASWRFIRSSGYPLAAFGLSHHFLLSSLVEATVFTVPFLFVATGMKWLVMKTGDTYAGYPLIEHPNVLELFSQPRIQFLVVVYAVSSAVQELIVRSALQSMMERFLVGPGHRWRAIIVCASLFSVSHLHMSFTFALLAFVPGVFWGWLFSRKRNLIGVTLSHVIVGCYVFFVMGVRLST